MSSVYGSETSIIPKTDRSVFFFLLKIINKTLNWGFQLSAQLGIENVVLKENTWKESVQTPKITYCTLQEILTILHPKVRNRNFCIHT